MSYKGQVLKGKNKQYVLKDQLTQGGFSMIYSTNDPEIICKIQILTIPSIAMAYKKEKETLKIFKHQNIVQIYDAIQTKGKQSIGYLLLQNCSGGTAFNLIENLEGYLQQKDIIQVFMAVNSAIEVIHNAGYTHRDIKLENILKTKKGSYKLCDFGSSTQQIITKIDKNNRIQIEQFIDKTTTPFYRSPQQLDLYSGFQIGTQVDIFAMGVLIFMLCFKKPPFQSRLSAINKQYFIPEDNVYSSELLSLIEKCFTTNPKNRPTAKQIKKQLNILSKRKKALLQLNYNLQLNTTIDELSRVNPKTFNTSVSSQSSFFSKIKLIYSQMTTQTQGWIGGFIEDSQEAPALKYNRFIISKCWEKRYKIQKVNQIIWNYFEQNKSKGIVTLKILILIHNFLRKGPTQVIEYDKEYSLLKLATKIYKHWKKNEKSSSPDDPKRNIFLCLLIRHYSLIIIGKTKFNYQNSEIFQGNFSIAPFFSKKHSITILKLPLLQSMLQFLQQSVNFHEIVQSKSYLIDIQRSIILSIVDEQYCLVSIFVFLYSTFKHAINFVDDELDLLKLKQKLQKVDNRFEAVYIKLIKLFDVAQKFQSLFEYNNFSLKKQAIDHIKNIKISNERQKNFIIAKYLNYKDNIGGLKIPLTYQQAVKNPNFLKDLNQDTSNQYIDINQYKKTKPKQEIKQVKNNEAWSSKNSNQKMDSFVSFQQFAFDSKNNQKPVVQQKKPQQIKKQQNAMEFTHQNLNRDFLTISIQSNNDRFKQFLSIVDMKKKQQEETSPTTQKKATQFEIFLNKQKKVEDQKQKVNSQNSKHLINTQRKAIEKLQQLQTVSVNSQVIKRMQLINFFDDGEEQQEKKQINIIAVNQNNKLNKTDGFNQKQICHIEQRVKSQKIIKSQNFIDLKDFIVQQVKKSAEQYLIDFSQLKFYEKVGNGHSSQVFRGQWRGRQVAIKKIKDNMHTPSAEKQFRREIMTSVKIRNHPQLVTLIGVAQKNNQYYIINEFCYGFTLFDLLHESTFSLSWKIRISIAKQIAKGIVFLHTNQPPIIHRDLKSLNVLLMNKFDRNSSDIHIKIADFGLSRDMASTYMTGTLGTYHWMAPQIFNNQPYSLKADVYSYGIMLWQIASRQPPYKNLINPQSLMKFITIEGGRPDLTRIDMKCPIQIRMLMMRCWDKLPSNRPNFQQILHILNSITVVL